MRAFVTGGAGFIGSHLVDLLILRGHKVTVFDDLSAGERKNVNKKARFVEGDIRDLFRLQQKMKGHNAVFHLAAIPSVNFSMVDPQTTHQVNVNGTLNVMLAAELNKIKRFVFASSCSVLGNNEKTPLCEKERRSPESPYAVHKTIGELYLEMFSKQWKMNISIMRFFNVYGPRQKADSEYSGVISKFIKNIKEKKICKIFGDGTQTRDFVYVEDAVKSMLAACNLTKEFGIYHIGSGMRIRILDLFSKIEKVMYLANDFEDLRAKFNYAKERKGEIKHSRADISMARINLFWKPETDLEEGLQKVIEYE